jgi:hypothetical protein
MPEHTLRHLADDAGDAVDLPEFQDLVWRARRRRRRRHASAALAAVGCGAVIAGAVLVSGDREGRAAPPVTSPSPNATSTPAPSPHYLLRHPVALVNQAGARLVTASYADASHAAAYWQVCSVPTPQRTCPEVVTWTSDGWHTSRARIIPDKLELYPLRDGSVVVWLFDTGFVLDADGHRHPLTLSSHTLGRAPGARYVNLPSGSQGGSPAGMLDTSSGTLYRPLSSPHTPCVYDDRWDSDGTIWEYGARHCGMNHPNSVAWSSDLGRSWTTRSESRQILGLVVTSHRTAVLLASQYNELAALDITDDGGRTWRRVVLQHPLVAPDSFAATPDGHLFVTSGSLYLADGSWTAFRQVRGLSLAPFGLTAADGVVATDGESSDRLAVSLDDGSTWRAVSPRP